MRVGLHMIVKDEAQVIERCLRTVRPHIAWWVVSDTGSTDGTPDLVRRVLAGVPGELVERPWVSFGHNRDEVLRAARASPYARPGDYTLWIDADDELVDVPEQWPALTADGYQLEVAYGASRFGRLHLVRLDRPWRWSGVLHEHLHLEDARTDRIAAPRILQHHDGARSRDPETYRRDAAILADELRTNPGDPRTQFYLAQSWRDAGEHERALDAYRVRVANRAGWEQERWFALFQVGRCLELLGRPAAEVADAYLEAYAADPRRSEPLVDLARVERERGRHEVAVLYARVATTIPLPAPDALFVDADSYAWRAHDELAVSCFWSGRYDEGRPAAEHALRARPDDPRLQANLEHFSGR
jgi:tetratricopeptide (TPR) repeat protein